MWNQVSCNNLFKDYLKNKQDHNLRQSIVSVKPSIDKSKPKVMKHLANKAKLHRMLDGNAY